MVFVLDTSGSMRGQTMTQARNALKYCLENLTPKDRFGLMNFATTVNKYTRQPAAGHARRTWSRPRSGSKAWKRPAAPPSTMPWPPPWTCAPTMKPAPSPWSSSPTASRPSARPTPDKILEQRRQKNTANTRIFTFGVGDDVNATLLDPLAEKTPGREHLRPRGGGHRGQGERPVRQDQQPGADQPEADGRRRTSSSTKIYPPQLPDLFHGSQLVVLGRYNGKGGKTTVKLTGMVGKETQGVRLRGELPRARRARRSRSSRTCGPAARSATCSTRSASTARRRNWSTRWSPWPRSYGITTPYTSYLVVPDGPVPILGRKGAEGGRACPSAWPSRSGGRRRPPDQGGRFRPPRCR